MSRLLSLACALLAVVVFAAGLLFATNDVSSPDTRLMPPSSSHLMGTDHLGRDVMSRTFRAVTCAGLIAFPAWLIAIAVGAAAGFAAAIRPRSLVAAAINTLIKIALTTPLLLVLLGLGAAIGTGPGTIVLVVALVAWAAPARHARSIARETIGSTHFEFAVATGMQRWHLIRYVLVPSCLPPVLISAGGILVEVLAIGVALTLFGFGPPPPAPTLGGMIVDGLRYLSVAPWLIAAPIGVLAMLCLCMRGALMPPGASMASTLSRLQGSS